MGVDQRCLVLAHDAAHQAHPGNERERRRCVGHPLHRDIRPEGAGVTEDVQCRDWRIAVEVVVDAVFHGAAPHQGMPRRDDVHRMPARRDAASDRFDRRSGQIARKARIGRGGDDDGVP